MKTDTTWQRTHWRFRHAELEAALEDRNAGEVGDGVPVVVALGMTGDGEYLPEPVNLDAFGDVDSRHSISPASRILADSKGDSMRRK